MIDTHHSRLPFPPFVCGWSVTAVTLYPLYHVVLYVRQSGIVGRKLTMLSALFSEFLCLRKVIDYLGKVVDYKVLYS